MTENPFTSPTESPNGNELQRDPAATGKDSYNIVTDTVTGVNTRWSDNKFQAIFVFVSVLVAAAIGAVLATLKPRWNLPWYGGALIGSFAGLVVGVFASGIFLMIYRAVRHMKGLHD